MLLIIDTTQKNQIGLKKPLGPLKCHFPGGRKSEDLVSEIDRFLHKNQANIQDLEGIIVARGPGSYTSTRIGVAVANALGFAFDLPVAGLIIKQPQSIHILASRGQKALKDIRKFKPIRPYYRTKTP